MSFAENVKKTRKNRGYTQQELADLISKKTGKQTYRATITTWESGKHEPSAATIKIVAEILGTTVDKLLGTTSSQTRSSSQHQSSEPFAKEEAFALFRAELVNRISERSEGDQLVIAMLCTQSSEQLKMLYQLTKVDPKKLEILWMLSQVDDAIFRGLCNVCAKALCGEHGTA